MHSHLYALKFPVLLLPKDYSNSIKEIEIEAMQVTNNFHTVKLMRIELSSFMG